MTELTASFVGTGIDIQARGNSIFLANFGVDIARIAEPDLHQCAKRNLEKPKP